MSKKRPEAELCEQFITTLSRHTTWQAYPETHGFDILLVADDFQIGLQAKTTFSAKLLSQTLPNGYMTHDGPNYRGVVVPRWNRDYDDLCTGLGLLYFYQTKATGCFRTSVSRMARKIKDGEAQSWSEQRLVLPKYVPDVAAGASNPVKLTPWKIKALEVIATVRHQGYITSAQMRGIGIDSRRWIACGWLKSRPIENADGKTSRYERGVYIIGPKPPKFADQHKRVYKTIEGEVIKKLS